MATNPEVFDFDIGDVTGEKGDTGNGIKSIELMSTSGLVKTYRITMTDDTTFDFSVSDGEDGNGISGASFDPQTNALTITFDDGATFTTPSLKGVQGDPGDDGYSPAVTIATITGGHRVTITDEEHPAGQSFDVLDGASDAGRVTYDETATYQAGSVGAELSDLTRQISDKQDYYLYTASGSIATFDDAISGSPIQDITVITKETQTGEGTPSLTNVRPLTCPTDLTINQSGADTSSPSPTVVDWSNTEAPLGIGTLHYNGDGTWTLTTLQVLVSVTYAFFSSASEIGIDTHNEVYIRNAFYNGGNGIAYRNRSRKSGGYKCKSNAFQVHFLNNSSHYSSQQRLYLINNGGWTSKNDFLADVQAYYNNGGTVQFLYEPTDTIPTVTLTTAEIFALTGTNNFWTTGDISVTYRIDVMDKINDIENRLDVVEAPAVDVIKSNEDAINKIWASRWLRSATANPLTLLWFSDIHRWQENLNRIIEFKNYLNSLGILNDTIVTGDLVRNAASEGTTFRTFWQGTAGTDDILVTLGNHDHYAQSETPHGRATFDVLDGLFFDRIDNWGVTRESNYPFYYKDYPTQKIRLIVADAFVRSTEADEESWLNSVLVGAKEKDYAVVIATHYLKLNSSSETTSVTILDNNWSNNLARATGTTVMDYEGTDTDIVKCVTAYIDSGGKFLCYMIGHTHSDIVSHPTGHPEQLIINCACASDDRSHETPLTTNDLPRYDGTRTKDCFNVITFDGVNQIIKCVRVGANVNMYQQPRTAFGYDVVNHQFISLI